MVSNLNIRNGTNVLDFGSYKRSTTGWVATVGPEENRTGPFKVDISWFSIKFSNQGTTQNYNRCFHLWE